MPDDAQDRSGLTLSFPSLLGPTGRRKPAAQRSIQFTQAGIVVTGTGVVDFTADTKKAARKAFENVKAAGVAKICARPQIESLPLLNRLVKEYDVKLAIHNHGPTDLYPTSTDVWPHILPHFDARIGICADVRHA